MFNADAVSEALVVIDGAEPAPGAAANARRLLPDAVGWTILAVIPEHPADTTGATGFAGPVLTPGEMETQANADLIAGDAAAAGTARGFGSRPVRQVVGRGDAARAVEAYGADHRADLVVVAEADLAEHLVSNDIVPLLVVPLSPSQRVDGPVLLAVDGSPADAAVIATAEQLFDESTTEYIALHVAASHPTAPVAPIGTITLGSPGAEVAAMIVDDDAASTRAEAVARAVAADNELDPADTAGDVGDAASRILVAADEHDVSMIMLGSRDRGWWSRLIRPSVSDAVIENARRPVLVTARTPE